MQGLHHHRITRSYQLHAAINGDRDHGASSTAEEKKKEEAKRKKQKKKKAP